MYYQEKSCQETVRSLLESPVRETIPLLHSKNRRDKPGKERELVAGARLHKVKKHSHPKATSVLALSVAVGQRREEEGSSEGKETDCGIKMQHH